MESENFHTSPEMARKSKHEHDKTMTMIDKEVQPTKEQEKRLREFLSRIEDGTGTVKRYAEYLRNKPTWRLEVNNA